MNTYTLLSGEIVEYPTQPAAVNAFLSRVTAAVNDTVTPPAKVLALVYGVENPILDTTSQPGRAIVTKTVFDNPVYRVLADLVGRKQLLAAGQSPEDSHAAYTLTVKDVADQLGLAETSVRSAITARKLAAVKRNGEWYVHPNSVASYKVSNRGRRGGQGGDGDGDKHGRPSAEVTARCGNVPGGSLNVKILNGQLDEVTREGQHNVLGHFPVGWTRAAVKTTTSRGVRVFELEPAPGEKGEVKHLDLYVAGEFRIVGKHNAIKAANEAWKKYA